MTPRKRSGLRAHGARRDSTDAFDDFVATLPLVLALGLVLAAGCSAPGSAASAPAKDPKLDPRLNEVRVPGQNGWNGTLVIDQGPTNGIWTVGVTKVFESYGCPEIVGLDDLGRCHVLWSYSGKWTPVTAIADGKWLGGLAVDDVDPRVPGREIYTGSQQGHLYEVVAYPNTALDYRRIGSIPGREIHTLVTADVDPRHAGDEVVVFTSPGGLYVAAPRTDGLDGFDVRLVEELPGRVRDALVLPARAGSGTEIATIGRHGKLEILRFDQGKPEWETVFAAPMGMGRVALRAPAPGQPLVLYSTSDDGIVRRHARSDSGAWTHEVVYLGRQGLRGICSGRFDADPAVETIAVFGYSKFVELLARRDGKWTAETIFEDTHKGHWICTGELDGRNATDEIVCSGYSGRVVLLSRPPGYGRKDAGAAVWTQIPTQP